MVVVAKFRGADGSLGYRKGKDYLLRVSLGKYLMIKRLDGTGICPYSGIKTFLNNWIV